MTPTDPVYIALTTMRGWMNAFIQTSRIDPERTSITFRGPDQLATCCKLQEVLDIADKALTHAGAREPVALITVLTPEEAKAAGRAAHVRGRDTSRSKLELWFFRDLTEEQRHKLIGLYGIASRDAPTQEHQKRAFRHILGMEGRP